MDFNVKKKLILASSSPRRKDILEEASYKPIVIKSFGEMDIIGKEYSKKLVCECARVKATESYEIYQQNLHKSVYDDINNSIEVSLGNEIMSISMKEVIDKVFDGNIEKYYNYLITNMIIVSADTVVANDGIIYGKPKDRDDAIHMLKSLSGKTHIVCTAICIGFYIDDATNIMVNGKNVEVENEDDKERIVFTSASEETKVTFKKLTDKEIEEYVDRAKPFDKAGAYGIQDADFSFVEKIDGNIDNVIGFPMKRFKEMLDTYHIDL